MRQLTKQRLWVGIRVVMVVVTICVAYQYWHIMGLKLCDKDDDECIKKGGHVSDIMRGSILLILIVLIGMQLMYALDIPITPLLATIGVFAAAIGFTVVDPLRDYVMGACLVLLNKLQLYDRVIIYGNIRQLGPIWITNLSPLTLDGVDDENHNVHIRYSSIQHIKVVQGTGEAVN